MEKKDRGIIISSVYNSLSDSYAKYIESLKNILQKDINYLHIVGGGSRDKLICKLTKDKTNIKAFAGPVECTAIGNILAQFKSLGLLKNVKEMRELVIKSFDIKEI
ncbi:FGGY-family carbohydrate kinase [Brachyspira aalborgi]|uniref:FGGY-family carbohydrate kinase n=1 Tax=Brachyspira aalborgi TaxID=29522 RepID=UPI00237B2EEF|nr:FGGY-family carbohydrate kinase [Brachyspira aalborgi]